MSIKRQHYVQFIAWPDTQSKPIKVESRDPALVRLPDKYSYAFYFFDRIEGEVEFEGETVAVSGSVRDESPLYFVGATVLTLDEYVGRYPKKAEAVKPLRERGWEKIVILRTGEAIQYFGDSGAIFLP